MADFQSFNPATGERLGTFTADSPEEVRRRVSCLRQAAPDARAVPLAERIRSLKRLRTAFVSSAPELARAVSLEIGKPYPESLSAELMVTLDGLDYLIKTARPTLASRRVPANLNARIVGFRRARIHHEPLGVIGILGTWNYPVFVNVLQIASALVAGNTVLWKPSELSPFVAAATLKLFREVGIDADRLDVSFGGRDTGAALAAAGCDKYILTGGVPAGRALLAAAAHDVRPSILELSGQDAAVVSADADLPAAARSLVWGAFTNCGQTCVAVRRIYYQNACRDRFVPAFLESVAKIRIGSPLEPDVDLGPLRTRELCERAETLVNQAVTEGAKILHGGHRLQTPAGNFFEPAVLTGIDETAPFFQQDVFGPITVLIPVESVREGIERANASRYGLGASLWTRSVRQGERLARDFASGIVSVNAAVLPVADPRLPFGGFKHSGYGRTHGRSGLLQMTAERVVAAYRPLPAGRGSSYPYRRTFAPLLQNVFRYHAAQSIIPKLKSLGNLVASLKRFLRDRSS